MTDRTIQSVLQIHTRYRQAGGEDQVVASERGLLEGAGIAVEQVLFDNADLRDARSLAGDIALAANAVWSRSAARRVAAAITVVRPQVVHVHNTFAAASPAVYRAASGQGVPVVQSLHNYRFVCPAATLYRDGRPCRDCVGLPVPLPAVIHACVRGSRAQSAVAATTIGIHRAAGTFRDSIDGYLVGTESHRQVMVDGGMPPQGIRVVPNFLEPDPGVGVGPRAGIVYVGRLVEEKGIGTLLAAADRAPGIVTVVGDGPMAPAVRAAAEFGRLVYLGPLWADDMRAQVRRAAALVVPSIWFEGFPIVVLEAFAAGTPVIASRIGSLADIVVDGMTGLLAEPRDVTGLAERLAWATDHPTELRAMGERAREAYEQRYRGPSHLAALLSAYADAIARRRRTPHG